MGHRSGQVGIRLSQLSTHSCEQHVGTRPETQHMFSHVRKRIKATGNNPSQSALTVTLINSEVVFSGLVEAMSTIQTPHAFPSCERLKANGTSGFVTNALLPHLRHLKKASKNHHITLPLDMKRTYQDMLRCKILVLEGQRFNAKKTVTFPESDRSGLKSASLLEVQRTSRILE